jgi:hypothetical protein
LLLSKIIITTVIIIIVYVAVVIMVVVDIIVANVQIIIITIIVIIAVIVIIVILGICVRAWYLRVLGQRVDFPPPLSFKRLWSPLAESIPHALISLFALLLLFITFSRLFSYLVILFEFFFVRWSVFSYHVCVCVCVCVCV